ncbi:MAG: VWA domain-containing protein [Panacagrimonas sp.]
MDLSALLRDFHFLRPAWLLALPPLLLLALRLSRQRGREGNWMRLIDADLLSALRLSGDEGKAGRSPWPWLALVWSLAVFALAGPSWQRDVSEGYRGSAAWVLVLDLSPSMAATDQSPNRVTRARYVIDDLLGVARDERVGLVVFSDEAYTVTPLTEDVATIRALLPPLAPELMPAPGDHLAPALEQAAKLLESAAARDSRVLVLSDGFDDPAAAFAAASALRSKGIALDVIGIGTAAGAPLPQGEAGFTQNERGQPQLARLDEGRLRGLAGAGQGAYADVAGLSSLIDGLQSQRAARDGGGDKTDIRLTQWRDAGVWLLPALLLFAALLSRRGWL